MEKAKLKNELILIIKSKSEYLDCFEINLEDMVFEEKVKIKCFQCKKYNVCWTCPPRIPQVDYKKIISEYKNNLIVFCKYPFTSDDLDSARMDSSNILHESLLKAEKFLWDNNLPLAMSFIGGSCKLCKRECSSEKCRQPHLARIPIEATGINVIETLKGHLDIIFPPKDYIYRIGLLLW